MRFTHAIVRPPSATFADGITTAEMGPPDLDLARAQHRAYCRALVGLGVSLVELPPDPAFPDSTFVEDAAVLAAGGAILTRPGAAPRRGEVAALEEALRPWHPEPARIAAPGTLDGGDVCEAGGEVFIGISERTNPEGAAQLDRWLRRRGLRVTTLDIHGIAGLLHLKTGLSWLGGRRLLAAGPIAEHESLRGWEVVRVPAEEAYAANCVAVNGSLLLPAGYRSTRSLLAGLGLDIVEVEMSEFRKMDGGPSCLSVRW